MEIVLDDVSFTFPGNEKHALKGISHTFSEGRIYAVTGPSGAGKSTLLRILSSLLCPDSGKVHYSGKSSPITEKVGYVMQYPEDQLFEKSVVDDVAFGPLNRKRGKSEAYGDASDALLSLCVPRTLWSRSPFSLSGGEKRLSALAGILALHPEVLVLDEISSGLDGKSRAVIFSVLKKLRTEGKTVIFTTHDMEEAADAADEIILLEDGCIRKSGRVTDIAEENALYMTMGCTLKMMLEEKGIFVTSRMESREEALSALSELLSGKTDAPEERGNSGNV